MRTHAQTPRPLLPGPRQCPPRTVVARKASCSTTYSNLEATYYSTDPTCKAAVKTAIQTYVRANCPDTSGNSTVRRCMCVRVCVFVCVCVCLRVHARPWGA